MSSDSCPIPASQLSSVRRLSPLLQMAAKHRPANSPFSFSALMSREYPHLCCLSSNPQSGRAVVVAKDMVPFESNIEKHGKGTRVKDFAIAMKEIAETPGITGRPAADPHPGLVSETISEMRESGQPAVDPDVRSGSDGSEEAAAVPVVVSEAEDSPAVAAPETPAAGSKRGSKKRTRVESGDSVSRKKKRKSSVSESDRKRSKSRSKRVKEEVAAPPSPTPQSESEQMNDAVEQEKTSDSEKLTDSERMERLKAKAIEKQKKKEELKAEKMQRKRQERLNQLKSQPVTVAMLRDVEAEIVESLSIEIRDAPRAIQAMGRLDVMAVTTELLISFPSILQTIRKCRKYVHDQQVRQKADYLHNKFKNQMVADSSLNPDLLKRMQANHKAQVAHSDVSKSKSESQGSAEVAAAASDSASSQSPLPAADVPSTQALDSQTTPTVGSADSGTAGAGEVVKSAEIEEQVKEEPVPDSLVNGFAITGEAAVAPDPVSPVVAAVVEKITNAVVDAVNSGETALTATFDLKADDQSAA